MGITSYIKRRLRLPIEESFRLKGGDARKGDTRIYSWKLDKGDRLVGEVTSDRKVWVYIMGRSSLWDFRYDESFEPEWKAEEVTRANVSFTAPEKARFHLVITTEVDEEKKEEVRAHARIRIER